MKKEKLIISIAKHILNVIIVVTMIGCTPNNESQLYSQSIVDIKEPELADLNNVSFQYSIDTSYSFLGDKIIKLDCELSNRNNDTLFFFTYSCLGWEYNFIIDTSKVKIHYNILCNVSYPIIKKIAPRKDFKFNGYFRVKDPQIKTIQPSYFIYQVGPKFDIKNKDSIQNLKYTILKSAENN